MKRIRKIAIAVLALIISTSSVFAFVKEISLQSTVHRLQPGNDSSQTDQYAYMPYGVATHTGNSQTPYQWLGGYGVYYDHTTELHLTLHRAYSADMRKFISPDPLGIDGGVNVYAYANLNPLFFVDPLGLCADGGGSAWYQHEALPGSTWQDLGMNASYAAQGLLRSPVDMVVGAFRGVQGVGTFLGNMSVDPAGTLQATADAIRNIPAAIGNWANDPQAIGSTVGQIGIGLGAAKVLNATSKSTGIKYIGKMDDLQNIPRNQTILDDLPDLGSAKANYYQNSSVLRKAIRDGYQIRDASAYRPNSAPDPTRLRPSRTIGQSFLGAERLIMDNKGFILNSRNIYIQR